MDTESSWHRLEDTDGEWERRLARPEHQLLRPFVPLLRRGRCLLQAGALTLTATWQPPFSPAAAADRLLDTLPGLLLPMLERTLVLEMHIARLGGELRGASPEERFAHFLQLVAEPDRRAALFDEYPVLARQLVAAIEGWAAAGLAFLGHLSEDWGDLCAMFAGDRAPGALQEVIGNLAERHCQGRAPLIAHFESGLRVVYKPRSLSVDRHFQELLLWWNRRGAPLPFRILAVVDLPDHGWMEYVEAEACRSANEVQHFYRRQGAYLALLYALEATDIHCDNLIAAGEHPVLVDLECLFHPRLPRPAGDDGPLGERLRTSVLRVGLLPQALGRREGAAGIDLSGLGGQAGQILPMEAPLWKGAGTDSMRLMRTAVRWLGSRNRPRLGEREACPGEHADEIVAGFGEMYHLLVAYRAELLAAGGPIARFAGDEVRAIIRPSPFYAGLLAESFHPGLLRDHRARERFFGRLRRDEGRPWIGRVSAAEAADLQAADLPRFTARPDSRDLWDSHGRKIAGFFGHTSLSAVRSRLRRLNGQDLARQVWFVRAALAPLQPALTEAAAAPLDTPTHGMDRQHLLQIAFGIAERLDLQAVGRGRAATWAGLTMDNRAGHRVLGPLGADLYGGLPGVALFLGYLGVVGKADRYTRLAAAALAALETRLVRARPDAVGAFWGWGGLLYTYSHLATLWERPDLARTALEIAEIAAREVTSDCRFDIFGGAAGCLGGLLSLYHCTSHPRVLAIARSCAEHLCINARRTEAGLGWISPVSPRPLAGFAHGGAGIAWALLRLFAIDGDERWRIAATLAIDHERSLFDTARGNWADLRDGGWTDPVAWCHGATGIGLARLDTLDCFGGEPVHGEITVALEATLQRGWTGGYCLCHGRLGNLELLVSARERIARPGLDAEIARWSRATVQEGESRGWHCGLWGRAETPGLMNGLAGIGYALLRLAAPQKVPSLLVLSAPPAPERC